jgi:hypothetical protein
LEVESLHGEPRVADMGLAERAAFHTSILESLEQRAAGGSPA